MTAGLTVGSLFSGIGGFDLGLERAGHVVCWQVESDPFCRSVLARHWPHVRRYEDVRTVSPYELEWVDIICGGFPCQDVSHVGQKAGIDGARSGLWSEFVRIVRVVRPTYVLVENTTGLFARGFGQVLGDLASLGYDAEWSVLSACALGAPHPRERVFILAYADGERQEAGWAEGDERGYALAAWGVGQEHLQASTWDGRGPRRPDWPDEPAVGRMADGIPRQLDRLGALGNAVVPQVAEWIGRALLESIKRSAA